MSRRRREVSVEQIEDLHEDGEADAFEIEWARRTLQEALQIMQTECEVSGKHQRWQVFQARIIAPLLTDAEPTDYAQLVSELGLESTAQVQNLLVTAKRHFTRSLETVVGRYADSQEEITAEIADLRRLLVAATSTEFAAEPMPGDEAGEALAGQARPDQVAKFLDLDYRHVWQRYLQKPLGELLPAVEAVVDKSPTLGELLQAPDPRLDDAEATEIIRQFADAVRSERCTDRNRPCDLLDGHCGGRGSASGKDLARTSSLPAVVVPDTAGRGVAG